MDDSYFSDVVEEKSRPQWDGVAASRNIGSEAGRKGRSCRNAGTMIEEGSGETGLALEGSALGGKTFHLLDNANLLSTVDITICTPIGGA